MCTKLVLDTRDWRSADVDGFLAALHEYVVDQAVWIWVVHDLNPRALAHKVKGFKPPQSWYVDLTQIDVEV